MINLMKKCRNINFPYSALRTAKQKGITIQNLNFTTGMAESKNPETPPKENYNEFMHLLNVVDAMKDYSNFVWHSFDKKLFDYSLLLPKYKSMNPKFEKHISHCKKLLEPNQKFLDAVAKNALESFRTDLSSVFLKDKQFVEQRSDLRPKISDLDKVVTTLKQCNRDWGDEGAAERENCYGVILKELDRCFPDENERHNLHVLNPGCGLSRLTWEIAKRGFSSQGNEFSYFMLFASHYILNKCEKNSIKIHPFINKTKNLLSKNDQTRTVTIPNVDTFDLPKNAQFSMAAGDFLEVYRGESNRGKWDAVVSCFFLDTARNPFQYLELISRILKPGGVFINLGPLLYHFAETENEFSMEVDLETLRESLPRFGLKLEKEEFGLKCGYCEDVKSMEKREYRTFLWVCRKVEKGEYNDEVELECDEKVRFGGLERLPKHYSK